MTLTSKTDQNNDTYTCRYVLIELKNSSSTHLKTDLNSYYNTKSVKIK